MPMEYFIEELTSKGVVFHGSVFSKAEALQEIDRIKRKMRTQNPLSYRAEYVPINQIEDADAQNVEIAAEDLYKETHGPDAKLSEADETVRRIYDLCAATANEIVAEQLSGIRSAS